jgi:hypothetical protein
MTYKITPQIREIMHRNDQLGFSSIQEACVAILNHDDWEQRWILEDIDDAIALNLWKAEQFMNATLELLNA